MRTVALALAGLAVLIVGVSAASAPRASATTGVDPLLRVGVKITDSRIVLTPKKAARMETVYFRVVNTGKRTHDFRVADVKTKPIKPGEVAHLLTMFVDRGTYVYRCALHCDARTMRGVIEVYSPIG
jgi:plastocyanin